MVSSIYRWAHKSYHVEPVAMGAARVQIKHLTSKPEMMRTIEALRSYNGSIIVGVRHVRKHKEAK